MSLSGFIKRQLKRRKAIRFYSSFVKKGDLCFDVGANTGERTQLFLAVGCKVVSFEPQAACFKILAVKYNHHPGVTLLKTALSDAAGAKALRLCSETTQCATFSDEFATTYEGISGFHWDAVETVNVTTLEKMVQQYGVPALCKIDVEGHELHVLQGMETALPLIMFEFNKPLLHQALKCLQLLSEKENYLVNFMAYEQMHTSLTDWVPIADFIENIYQLIPEEILTGEIIVKR